MTVKEAAYDGNRLLVTVAYVGHGISLDEQTVGRTYMMINGEEVGGGGRGGQKQIDVEMIIEHRGLNFEQYDEYGEEIEITIGSTDAFGTTGNLEVKFSLEKIHGMDVQIQSNATTDTAHEQYTITADKVTFSELATRIDLTVGYPVEMDETNHQPWFEYSR